MRTLARIEIDDDGKIVVASNLPPGPLVAALAAGLAQVATYIPVPDAPRMALASVPLESV